MTLKTKFMSLAVIIAISVPVFAEQNEDLPSTQEKSKRTPVARPATDSIKDSKVEKLQPKQGDVVAKPAKDVQCVPNLAPAAPGKTNGLKCTRIKPDGELAKVGIVEGDVVISIDGELLNSPSASAILHSKAKTRQFSEIRILRNGQEVVLR